MISIMMRPADLMQSLICSAHTYTQKQQALLRQLEEELRLAHMRNPDQEIQQHIDALYSEKEHMSKEIYLLRETIKVLFVVSFYFRVMH
jgi:hypothetical protein